MMERKEQARGANLKQTRKMGIANLVNRVISVEGQLDEQERDQK
jgi:hypothetical protein